MIMSADPKPLNDHQRLLKGLHDLTGPISDGKAQGQAAKWLIENGYTVEESLTCLQHLIDDPRWKERDHKVSLQTVKSYIGTWRARKKEPPRVQVDDSQPFTKEEAERFVWELLSEGDRYKAQIEMIREQFGLS